MGTKGQLSINKRSKLAEIEGFMVKGPFSDIFLVVEIKNAIFNSRVIFVEKYSKFNIFEKIIYFIFKKFIFRG